MTNSRDKGCRGERAAAKFLTNIGFPAIRGQQHRGGSDSPDVRVPSLPNVLLEVKYGARAYINFGVTLHRAMEQADADALALNQRPACLWYQTGGIRRWVLTWEESHVNLIGLSLYHADDPNVIANQLVFLNGGAQPKGDA